MLYNMHLILTFLRNGRFRNEHLTKLIKGKKQYQLSTFTFENRYPWVFEMVSQLLSDLSAPKILSFGCSTGEEVASLHQYFKQATIIGVDINPWCIHQCRKKWNLSNCFSKCLIQQSSTLKLILMLYFVWLFFKIPEIGKPKLYTIAPVFIQ